MTTDWSETRNQLFNHFKHFRFTCEQRLVVKLRGYVAPEYIQDTAAVVRVCLYQ